MALDIKNSLLPPNIFNLRHDLTEVIIPRDAKLKFNGFSLGGSTGYAGQVTWEINKSISGEISIYQGDEVILRRKGRIPGYQVVTGK